MLGERIQKTLFDVVRLLGALTRTLRTPLLILCLMPMAAGVLLLVVTGIRGGPDVPLAMVLLVAGLVPGLLLGRRRRQLLQAMQPPREAADEIYEVLASLTTWELVRSNLGEISLRGGRPALTSLGRRIWKGVSLTNEMRGRLQRSDRLAPYLPGRLRSLVYLSVWCLVSTAVLLALAVVKALASAAGIG